MPGAGGLLETLRGRALPWAVVTSARHQFGRGSSLGGRDRSTGTRYGGRRDKGQRDPEGYLLAARRLGVDPSRCLVVEDSEPATVSSMPDDWMMACESRSAMRLARLLSPASARSLASDDSREWDAAASARAPPSSHPTSRVAEVAKAIDTRSGLMMTSSVRSSIGNCECRAASPRRIRRTPRRCSLPLHGACAKIGRPPAPRSDENVAARGHRHRIVGRACATAIGARIPRCRTTDESRFRRLVRGRVTDL